MSFIESLLRKGYIQHKGHFWSSFQICVKYAPVFSKILEYNIIYLSNSYCHTYRRHDVVIFVELTALPFPDKMVAPEPFFQTQPQQTKIVETYDNTSPSTISEG
jgi:hypothetical protein